MNEESAPALESAAINSVAAQLKDATDSGQSHNRNFVRQIRHADDQHVQIGPRRLGLSSSAAILAVIVLGGTTGFLGAATARTWPMAGLLVILMTLGVFLLDQVRLMQHRDDALKVGLYLLVTNHRCPAIPEPARDDSKA